MFSKNINFIIKFIVYISMVVGFTSCNRHSFREYKRSQDSAAVKAGKKAAQAKNQLAKAEKNAETLKQQIADAQIQVQTSTGEDLEKAKKSLAALEKKSVVVSSQVDKARGASLQAESDLEKVKEDIASAEKERKESGEESTGSGEDVNDQVDVAVIGSDGNIQDISNEVSEDQGSSNIDSEATDTDQAESSSSDDESEVRLAEKLNYDIDLLVSEKNQRKKDYAAIINENSDTTVAVKQNKLNELNKELQEISSSLLYINNVSESDDITDREREEIKGKITKATMEISQLKKDVFISMSEAHIASENYKESMKMQSENELLKK